ncbi:glycosyltransferase [Parabacteroides sp. APC149_11_2_Y6]
MNILHITNSLSEGGVETLLFSLCKGFISQGHFVSILVLERNKCDLMIDFEKLGVKIIRGRYSSSYNILNIISIYKLIPGFDIIHAHLFPTQYLVSFAGFISQSKGKILTTEHNTYNHRRDFKIFRFIDSIFYSGYSKIVGISNATTIELQKWIIRSICKSPIHTINNGIDIFKFRNPIIALKRSELGLSESDKIVIMVARFNEQKDHETLIRAFSLLHSSVHLFLVGSGETMDVNKQLVLELGLEKRIHFLGNRKDVPAIIKISDIGVLSSFWEGFGLSALEYMAGGIPALVSNLPGLNKVVDNDFLLFEPGDFKGLANKIVILLTDKKIYNKMSEYSLCQSDKFSIENTVNSYIELYTSLSKF